MGQTYDKARAYAAAHKKMLIAIVSAVLGLLFILSILLSIFAGGEFSSGNTDTRTKGIIRLNDTTYSTSYFAGDKFSFDKENASITLVAKDNVLDRVIRVDELPAPEYGFMVNGQGDIIYEPDQITMTQDVKTIDVVSKVYPDVRETIEVNVYGAPDTSKLVNSLTIEAEDTDLYWDDKLLTQEEKATLPSAESPFLAASGNPGNGYDAELLSGNNCLRNFNKNNMRVEFRFVSTAAVQAQLTITVCMRPDAGLLSEFYVVEYNGERFTAAEEMNVPGAGSGNGYYRPYDLNLTVNLQRGVNVLSFESGSAAGTGSPVNLDAVTFTTADGSSVIGGMDVLPAEEEGNE